MKILIKYKHGFFGAVRKLQILANDETLISEIRQGESKHIEILDKCKVIYGKMDWAETNKVDISKMSEEEYIEISGFFSFNPLIIFGVGGLPIRLTIKRQSVDLRGMTKLELEEYGRKLGIELDRRKNELDLIQEIKAVEKHWR